MNPSFLGEVVRRNWYLFILLAVCAAGVIVFGRRPAEDLPRSEPRPNPERPADRATSSGSAGTPRRLTPDEETAQTIAQHLAEFNAAPQDERAPALLLSIGNLYLQKLQDYDQAIANYERVIAEYRDWEGIRKAYLQLATAYEKDGQFDRATSVYHEMMRQFPPDSVEYQYAKGRLAEGVTATPE